MGDLINLYTAEDDIVKMKEIVSKARQTRDRSRRRDESTAAHKG